SRAVRTAVRVPQWHPRSNHGFEQRWVWRHPVGWWGRQRVLANHVPDQCGRINVPRCFAECVRCDQNGYLRGGVTRRVDSAKSAWIVRNLNGKDEAMPAEFKRIKDIFLAAVGQDGPAEREAYLAAACDDDAALRQHVEALLRRHEQAGSFLEPP